MQIAVIGGGAAGFFAAITAKESCPDARVVIFEKSDQVLAKVRISGGGRCNLTNGCGTISELCDAYPRGGKALKKAFHNFNNRDTIRWFESRNVPLIIQDDLRVFPKSGDSTSIIECFLKESKRLGIEIKTGMPVRKLVPSDDRLEIVFDGNHNLPERFDKIIVTTGGSPKRSGLEWLERLGHRIEDPVPSLFSFNMPNDRVRELMGVSVDKVMVRIQGTNYLAQGSLLIAHWGMSGPVILKLSSIAARYLNQQGYHFKINVNWAGEVNNEFIAGELNEIIRQHPHKLLSNYRPYAIPGRLWEFLLNKIELNIEKPWGEVGKKSLNRLVNVLANDEYKVEGQTTFRDEFVTCGGVSLESVNMNTMESKVCKNLYFAGEVLDIDAITGGFNLQGAWTTGWTAGKACGTHSLPTSQ